MNDKKRRIGHSMKPREAVNSTAVDMQEPENTPDLGGEEGSESVVPLDGELTDLGEKEAKSVENSEIAQPEPKVASEAENTSKEAEKEENAQPSSLEEMLAASVERPGHPKAVDRVDIYRELPGEPRTYVKIKGAEPFEIVADQGEVLQDLEPKAGRHVFSSEEIEKMYTALGPQADGTYKLVVAIPEGYIEGVKTQAQLDNMTPEEWVSFRLAEYFEQWWFAQGQSK